MVLAFVRGGLITTIDLLTDPTGSSPLSLFLSTWESILTVTSVSIPTLRPLWRRWRGGSTNDSSAYGKSGNYSATGSKQFSAINSKKQVYMKPTWIIHGLSIPSLGLGRSIHSVSMTWSRRDTMDSNRQPEWAQQITMAGTRWEDIVVNCNHHGLMGPIPKKVTLVVIRLQAPAKTPRPLLQARTRVHLWTRPGRSTS